LRFFGVQLPGISNRRIDARTLSDGSIHIDDDRLVSKDCFLGLVALDHLIRRHQTTLIRRASADLIRDFRVGIDQRGFDLQRLLFVHVVPMNDVGDFESVLADFADPLELIRQLVVLGMQFPSHMLEYPIAAALSHVKRLTIAQINQPIDVVFQLIGNELRKHIISDVVSDRPQTPLPTVPRPLATAQSELAHLHPRQRTVDSQRVEKWLAFAQ
jgi:hypothetical protein